jgi:hypothetical protein
VRIGIFKAVQSASQRLGERGMFERNAGWNAEGVSGDDFGRDAYVFRVGAVIEEELFAEILLGALAKIAVTARRRIDRHDAIAEREVCDAFANFSDSAGEFMAEERRWLDHLGVVTSAEDFQVRTACEGDTDFQDQFAGSCAGNRNLLDAYIFLPVEYGCGHELGQDCRS